MISDILSKPRGSKHKPLFGPQNIWTFWQHKFCNSATIMWYLLSGKHSRKTTAKPQKQLMTRFLARLKKQRLGKFLVRNMAFRALICHYVFVFPLSSDSSWTMSPTQHFHHHSPWDKGTQRIFTTFSPQTRAKLISTRLQTDIQVHFLRLSQLRPLCTEQSYLQSHKLNSEYQNLRAHWIQEPGPQPSISVKQDSYYLSWAAPLTFGRNMSPGYCRLRSTCGYAREADVVSFIDGDIWRNLYNFGRYCGDKTGRRNIKTPAGSSFHCLKVDADRRAQRLNQMDDYACKRWKIRRITLNMENKNILPWV